MFDISDGSLLIVSEYLQREAYWTNKKEDEYYFHFLQKGKQKYSGEKYDEKYRHATASETELVKFLKDLQKK